jgi:hypothetical protein
MRLIALEGLAAIGRNGTTTIPLATAFRNRLRNIGVYPHSLKLE